MTIMESGMSLGESLAIVLETLLEMCIGLENDRGREWLWKSAAVLSFLPAGGLSVASTMQHILG